MSYRIERRIKAISQDTAKKIQDEMDREMGEKNCPYCGGNMVFRDGRWISKEVAP